NVGASLEEITLQSAKVRQDAFQKLAEKNRMTDSKLQEYYQFLKANEGVIRYSGSVLHQIRELKGITIMELATVTCVRGTYLESIEKENFETFPSSVYLKGYLHCYLKALELPLEEVSEQYMTLFDEWNEGGTRKNSI
ncbi:MAG: helix-turn-helix domain-containing protein, partial [SAR324 cluster bacterium]|nr:helix-turn-helix domain-containing protein [SAR324 cluster bacterium]